MKIQINEARCSGCGGCVETCPEGALSLSNSVAKIDHTLCSQCQACIDVCPADAITAMPDASMVIQQPTAISNISEARPIVTRPQPWLASALVFAGQTILPRLADVLIGALEHRLTQPTTAVRMASTSSHRLTAQGRGMQRQVRYRGGRNR